ncbi:membrane dipeptidase [Marinicauda pacifica]|uniref:Dipeptidase n=1 Tax=Marinicauda pacifica TaxID=1133559 RepID=A0A4S2HEH1_9PROT|nr:membrane dipeptidase [Marinicauda pacifica]TGY94191.1 dipeptidase [Marinicauda pacifica]GGE33705.1 membrane dipeptidase [Marinicauda pacifica]
MKLTANSKVKNARGATRRNLLKGGLGAALAAPMLNSAGFRVFAQSETTYSARAIELVDRSLVIDMLSILADLGDMLEAGYSESPKLEDGLAITDAHLEKLRTSGINVFHPAVGLGGRDSALAFIARLNAYAAERPDVFRRIDAVSDFDRIMEEGRIGYIVGIQNAQHFETPDDVNEFYNLGQRVSQLTYNSQNRIGAGATERVDGGVTHFGAAIIERMNEVGMAVDVSHCGDRTTLDAFEISSAPVLITHSNARALVGNHPRAKSDEAIRAMARQGGVMGITGVRNFVRDREPTTIEHLLDHFDYVADLVGIEHVGVGTDMDADGYDDVPQPAYDRLRSGYNESYAFRGRIDTDGFDHPKKIFDLTEGLIRRGYSDADIELVLGGNFRRALGQIWKP